jgi:hypothetical protein
MNLASWGLVGGAAGILIGITFGANRQKALEFASGLTKSPKEVLDAYFATSRDYYRDRNGASWCRRCRNRSTRWSNTS